MRRGILRDRLLKRARDFFLGLLSSVSVSLRTQRMSSMLRRCLFKTESYSNCLLLDRLQAYLSMFTIFTGVKYDKLQRYRHGMDFVLCS